MRRAFSPGSLPRISAAFGTGSLDRSTAATSTDSSAITGRSCAGVIAVSLSHGSVLELTPALRRNRLAVDCEMWPSITDSAPSMPPGKARPTDSSSETNSDTT